MKKFAVLFSLCLSLSATLAAAEVAPASPPAAAPAKMAPAKTTDAKPLPPVVGPPVAPAKLVDINSASEADLIALPGVGEKYAKKIIAGRPYAKKDQLKSRKILPAGTYTKVQKLIIADQPSHSAVASPATAPTTAPTTAPATPKTK